VIQNSNPTQKLRGIKFETVRYCRLSLFFRGKL
jgi:hypothetical protein